MANWKYRLNVKDAWKRLKDNEISIQEFAGIAREKLKIIAISSPSDAILIGLIAALDQMAQNEDADTDDFDALWDDVYNWADQETASTWPPSRLCWVSTF